MPCARRQLLAHVLQALNPVWAFRFAAADGGLAFLALGSVVLAVTGAEALYADPQHPYTQALLRALKATGKPLVLVSQQKKALAVAAASLLKPPA